MVNQKTLIVDYARVAQWIERQPSKLKVAGSIPAAGTIAGSEPLGERTANNISDCESNLLLKGH